jgi:glycosyltransferase A (GT-A) superfamily protein (DUF2064 family)
VRPRLIVLAKAPVAGRSKTRLCPPCTPTEAALIAEAALADTLAAVASTSGAKPVLALEGRSGRWLPNGVEVVRQRGRGLDERIATAFAGGDEADEVGLAGGPAVVIGMDTPQVTPGLLLDVLDRLEDPAVDAILGSSADGGWWALGLRRPDPEAVLGVPMSLPITGAAQRGRLAALGLRCACLPQLRDVDRFEDAMVVASLTAGSRFAETVDRVRQSVEARAGRNHPVLAGASR